jgi:hypothetical protein
MRSKLEQASNERRFAIELRLTEVERGRGIERLQRRGKPIPQSLKNILRQYTDEFVAALSSNGER